jgi:hypothetical protein
MSMPQTYWAHTLKLGDIFHSEVHSFTSKRDIIVERIRGTGFFDDADSELMELVDELADSRDIDEFDRVWDYFYDWADANRVWVVTR